MYGTSIPLILSKTLGELVEKLSITQGAAMRTLVWYTASKTAFMHLIILIALSDLLLVELSIIEHKFLLVHAYVMYFYLATVIKTLIRLPKILSLR